VKTRLQALLILFERDFQEWDACVELILGSVPVRGRPIREWIDENTHVRSDRSQDALKRQSYLENGAWYFRHVLGDSFNPNRIEVATVEALHGIGGIVLTHWSA